MIEITSFGYLHDDAPTLGSDLTLDARHLIRDPHVDPALRQMTGRDVQVVNAVMGTPGAQALVDLLVQAANALSVETGGQMWIRVAIGCQGGRHRSVVLATEVANALARLDDDREIQLYHRDVDRPVVERQATA